MKKNYTLIFLCCISMILIANISTQLSFNKDFDISLKDIDALADASEGGWPSMKEFSCFVGKKGNPEYTFLKEERYCGDCKSARIQEQTGIGHCKSFE